MADLTQEEESTYKAVEDAFFGILWTLQTTRKNPLVNLNLLSCLGGMVLDLSHMLAFFVHRFGWGNITITWGTYVRYIQLQLPLYQYEGFAIAFWAAVGITVFIVLNSIIVGHSFWTKNFNQLWAIKLLHFVVAIFFNFVFIASFYLLTTPWWCDPVANVLIPFAENGQKIGCFDWPNILSVVMGTLSIIVLVFLVFTSTLAAAKYDPEPNDLDAICSPAYRLIYNICLMFMTIDEYYIAKVIPVTGHWWEAMFNLILITGCMFTLVYYLPYQLQLGNELRGGMLGLLWWTAACSFVCINLPANKNYDNRIIDYILLGGMIPACIIGSQIVRQRYIVMRAWAASLIDQIDENFTTEEIQRAKFGTKKSDLIVGSDRDPTVYLPKSLQLWSCNLTTIEIIGRLLWFDTNDKRNHEAAFKFYRLAELAYPDIAYVKLLRATCLVTLNDDSSLAKSQMEVIKKLNPTFSVRFALYKREMEAKQKGNSTSSNKSGETEDSLDLVAYVEFQKYYLEAQRYNAAAVDAIREFWSLFLQPEITFVAFNNAARNIESQTAKALATYKTLLIRYPKHIAILTSYGYFLDLVMHNAEEAQKYHRRADEIRSRENETSNKLTIDGSRTDTAVISINEDGAIESVNKAFCNLFGYLRLELIGRNVKSIIASPWKERHDFFLDRYKSSGEPKILNQPARTLYGMHKVGYSIAVNLTVQERRKENGDKSFVAMLVQIDAEKKEGVIIIRESGIIVMISKAVTDIFGYSPVELLREDVSILMNEAYAANHESYLKRYQETGEARVIGTAGRNVPARRKDGSIFPLSLTVEEESVGYEKFYIANLTDTTHLKATIYIDGFGTVQNVDQGITMLLGYKKDDIIGQNIKGIMPPPYNSYHDTYLERYRRTKVSNILRSTEGRILPAVHADGSIVSLKAIITRADSGEASGLSSTMLFRGILQRVDNSSLATVRQGFRDNDYLEMNKNGVIKDINRSLILALGWGNETPLENFIGQSIDTIIPPVPSRTNQARGVWLPKCLGAPDLNFYILTVNKGLNLLPYTINCAMKSADTIVVRFKDISCIDAIISIDEEGTVQGFNEDSFLLFGHDPDEVIGRNIKYILPQEVAVKHDSYIKRYVDTRKARAVGIPRQVNTIHRDQTVMPVEIQIAEISNQGIKNFVGRIRHLQIEEKVSKELIEGLTVIASKDNEIIFEDQIQKSLQSLKKTSRSNSQTRSRNLEDEGSSQADEESEEDSDSDRDIDIVDNQGIDAKLRYIKESDAQDSSSLALAAALKYSMISFALVYIIALVVFNALPSPSSQIGFMQQMVSFSNIVGDVIAHARQLQLQQTPSMTSSYPCSWDPNSINACAFAKNNNATKDIIDADYRINEFTNWLTNNYLSLRTPGDDIDKEYASPQVYYDFVAGNPNKPEQRVASTWGELSTTKLRSHLKSLASNTNLGNANSKLAWNFVIYNREILFQDTQDVLNAIPNKIRSMLTLELIIHLIFAIVLLVLGGAVYFIAIGPRLNVIHNNRMLILKLVLLVPRAVIWEFVYVMYRDSSEEEENDDSLSQAESKSRAETSKIKANATKKQTDEVTEIIPDKKNATFLNFILGLFSLSVPAIIHCAWRLTDNQSLSVELRKYQDTTELYTQLYSFIWRNLDVWATQCPDMTFCRDLPSAKGNLSRAYNDALQIYRGIQTRFAGNDEFSTFLYRIEAIDPLTGKDFCPSAKTMPESVNTRCNDTYNGMNLPSDFSLRATRGTGTYAMHALQGASVLSETTTTQALNVPEFWFTWESMPIEGSATLKGLVHVQEDIVMKHYENSRSAANATYAVSLVYSIILFLWVFGTIRNNLQNESKHNRSILFMIPLEVVKKNRMILDYIDRVFIELSS